MAQGMEGGGFQHTAVMTVREASSTMGGKALQLSIHSCIAVLASDTRCSSLFAYNYNACTGVALFRRSYRREMSTIKAAPC